MTHDKLQEATEAYKALSAAKFALAKFKVQKHMSSNVEAYAVKSQITITVCDGLKNQTREIVIPGALVKHLYHQELNRLRAEVHHLTTAFERI